MSKKHWLTCPIKDWLDREVEKPILEGLYLEHHIATDQLRRDYESLVKITRAFNQITGRDFEEGMLLQYMFNRRKAQDWPKLGTSAKKFRSVLNLLPAEQITVLKNIYLDLDITSDKFLFDPAQISKIAQRFQKETGKRIPGPTLVGIIVAKRKRGEWPKIREAFGDISALQSDIV
jgi:hypothetical protein